MIRNFRCAIILGASLVLAGPVLAQGLTSSSLRNFDSQAPIEVDADRIEVLDREDQAIFTGAVRVTQDRLVLEANRIRVNYSQEKAGDPVVRRLDADGSVRVTTPTERATARFGIYDVEKRILTMLGDVNLVHGDARTSGNRLIINMETGRSTMDGQTSTGQPGGRVSGSFVVPERK